MMRRSFRSPAQVLLTLLGLLLLLFALWGIFRSYPDFGTIRAVPASVTLPPPEATAAP